MEPTPREALKLLQRKLITLTKWLQTHVEKLDDAQKDPETDVCDLKHLLQQLNHLHRIVDFMEVAVTRFMSETRDW